MIELFEKKGYEIVDFDTKADVYVINTCDVTNESGRKSRQIIRKAIRKNPSAKVAVVGCYAQLESGKVSNLPGVSVVVGTKDRHKIVDLVEKAKESDKQVVAVGDIMKQRTFEEIAFKGHRQKTRAFLKIQEGCNMFCSYCIIPYARGPIRSRAIESILLEVNSLAKDGFKEIVLTGIHLGFYGFDFKENKNHLLDVISRISQIQGIERIRLSSIEALELTDEFLEGLLQIKSFCQHFHIPLQSGCDTVLERMNRRYTTSDFRNRVNYIRKLMPGVSITTDVIVGFPGETDEEFFKTESFIQELEFSKLHVFPFSARQGTLAADMPNQIEKSIKVDRSHRLIHLSRKLEQSFREKFINTTKEVLFEDKKGDNKYEGLTDNYIKVIVESEENLRNQIRPVKLLKNMDDYILGEIKK
ncbi:MAG: tRNA (N(6)-L-threonylcarbamoyladenosine(37)-C(2))-methylthiotransferase MtaB [Thermoanaerobacteraceae bacterium]|nr:tRNA (N(6)-L-threonylcarbamoyladenosine(37)-C(2))-methylthiotransferase MtaB [Thermoanaerobacteraceae bacterium]